MKVPGDAVDQVRREEAKTRPELAKSRYVWLKNRDKLPASQQEPLAALTMSGLNLKTARAWQLKKPKERHIFSNRTSFGLVICLIIHTPESA